MFTQPVFIRNNTAKLRKKLKKLGYKLNNGNVWGCFLVTFRIKETREWRYVASPEWDLQNNPDIDISIDCGTNENLFLALAALRDDSDINQWFVHKSGAHWINCEENSFVEYYPTINEDEELLLEDWHKATAEELIERFEN